MTDDIQSNRTEYMLCDESLSMLSPKVQNLPYDRAAVKQGILHIGPGAFHRAHQAVYVDSLLAHDPKWGIHAVSMRSNRLKSQIGPQDGLYTLAILDHAISYRVIGSLVKISIVGDDLWQDSFLSPDIKLVTLTVTEKGYCLDADGELDLSHPDIRADLTGDRSPKSAISLIVRGLKIRQENGLPPMTILSCDNLPHNGRKLRCAVLKFAKQSGYDFEGWIAKNVSFPNSMVDSITPATDEALKTRIQKTLGYEDNWPIQREAFSSWVIERTDIADFPDFCSAGAVLTNNVMAYEQAKLRLLNGTHSALTYIGLAQGHKTVYDAMLDAALKSDMKTMMIDEIKPTLETAEGLDLDQYIVALIDRFSNPSIKHFLSQIAWDGSKKLPIRLLGTIADNLSVGRSIHFLSLGVAAWMRCIRRMAHHRDPITDPMAEKLTSIGRACEGEPKTDVLLFLKLEEIFPEKLTKDSRFIEAITAAYREIIRREQSVEAML